KTDAQQRLRREVIPLLCGDSVLERARQKALEDLLQIQQKRRPRCVAAAFSRRQTLGEATAEIEQRPIVGASAGCEVAPHVRRRRARAAAAPAVRRESPALRSHLAASSDLARRSTARVDRADRRDWRAESSAARRAGATAY